METIEEKAKEYAHATLVGSPYVKENAYIQGAKDILHTLMLTMSISEDGYLEENLVKMIKYLKGNLTFEDVGYIEDDLNL
jgi:flagellin-specific chaperone FliS